MGDRSVSKWARVRWAATVLAVCLGSFFGAVLVVFLVGELWAVLR